MPKKPAPAAKAAQKSKKYTAYMCSHTHWDREWYGSFQEFRMRLVRLIDRLIVLLEKDPSFKCFNLDGQTIVLEDYLEIKPEMRGRLEKLIRERRILIGPWYILPDEWLVSGESTVRNLLRGRGICREFGIEPPAVGYLPDMFGHISQMPQLLNGFGIDKTIMWRGLSGEQYMSELWWESSDGSKVLAFHLPEYCGYCNAAFFYHSLPPEARTLDPDLSGGWMATQDVEFAATALRAVADRAIAKSHSGVLLFMNGVDHMEAQPQVPAIISRANETLPDVDVRHASFGEFLEALAAASPKKLQTVRGELRDTTRSAGSWSAVLPNILSSRIYLKIANAQCQTLLERWSEPFCSAAAMVGNEYPQGMIHTGWKWLLRNHPHDSIGGCSVDAVHRHMETRFEWASEIADITANQALYQITNAAKTDSIDEGELAYYVFNPLNWDVSDLVVVDIDVDEESGWLKRHGLRLNRENPYETMRNIRIRNWDGSPVDYEILDVKYVTHHRPWCEPFGPTYQTIRFRVALWADKLPALGYKGYRFGAVTKPHRLDDRHSTASPTRMMNEHLTVDVNPNGTLRVTGAAVGGRVLDGLHWLEDGGDNGDGYTYSPPRHDAVVTTLGGPVQISRLTDARAVQSIAVDYLMSVPVATTGDRQHRSTEATALKVRSVFSLGAHSRRIDVETTVTNTASDHRLRVCFPVRRAGDKHVAEMQFDVVERQNVPVQPTEDAWLEDAPLEQAQQGFVSYSNLAVANFGLPEYELADEPSTRGGKHAPDDVAVLKLTLLRAVNWLGAGPHNNTNLGGAGPMIATPDQQMIGRTLTFRYSIIPHKGDWVAGNVQREAHQHNALWRGMTTGRHEGSLPGDRFGFVRVEGAGIVMSALKQVEHEPGHYVVRFWNSGSKATTATLKWFRKPARVHLSNLNEQQLKPLKPTPAGTIPIVVKPRQVVTVRFALN